MKEEESETKTENSEEKLVNEKNLININNKKRMTIFICLTAIAILSSCDGGIIPQQNINIIKDFNANEEQSVGLFGSIDYIGRIVGAIIFTIIMGKMNRKMILVSTLIFKTITLFIPLFTVEYYINIIARCLSGLSQVFYPTYLPVWCDQYGKKDQRAMWVTIVQIGNPLGIIIGYGISMFCERINLLGINGWRTAFAIEGITLIICAIIILFFDSIYFSEKFVLIDDTKGKEEEKGQDINFINLFTNIGSILSNKIFLFSSFCNSVAFFGIGVVQYFGDKYMKLVLDIDDSVRFIFFGSLCLLGPTLGMVLGGVVCSKLGGYVKRNSMTFVIISMAVASIISMTIACHQIIAIFVISSLTYLFAIGAVIPPLSGIIISCLDNNLRGDGFSICNFLNNLLGNFLSSYVYSLLVDAFDSSNNQEEDNNIKYRKAWMISMGYNFVGLLFVIIAGIFRYRIKGELWEDEEKKNNEQEEEDAERKEIKNEETNDSKNEETEDKIESSDKEEE